jgi:hypothetical protein
MLQNAVKATFDKVQDPECQSILIQIVRLLTNDTSKQLSLDFVRFIIRGYLEHKIEKEVEATLLNPRLSLTLYPGDLWQLYIENKVACC